MTQKDKPKEEEKNSDEEEKTDGPDIHQDTDEIREAN